MRFARQALVLFGYLVCSLCVTAKGNVPVTGLASARRERHLQSLGLGVSSLFQLPTQLIRTLGGFSNSLKNTIFTDLKRTVVVTYKQPGQGGPAVTQYEGAVGFSVEVNDIVQQAAQMGLLPSSLKDVYVEPLSLYAFGKTSSSLLDKVVSGLGLGGNQKPSGTVRVEESAESTLEEGSRLEKSESQTSPRTVRVAPVRSVGVTEGEAVIHGLEENSGPNQEELVQGLGEESTVRIFASKLQRDVVIQRLKGKIELAPVSGQEAPANETSIEDPFTSVYLDRLHMEVMEVPARMTIEGFMALLKEDGYVADAQPDEIIEGAAEPQVDWARYLRTKLNESDEQTNISHGQPSWNNGTWESLEKGYIGGQAIPNDPRFSEQWALLDSQYGINAISAWDTWTGLGASEPFTVALIDSGVDLGHEDLQGRLWVNRGEICDDGIDNDGNGFVDDCYGWDFIDEDAYPQDGHGHGTASAGIIAASVNNGVGIAPICWNCRVMILRALNDEIKGAVSGFVRALDYALAQKVRISSNSYGGRTSRFGALEQAVERAREQGMIFVAAAGNYNENNDNDKQPTFPASYGFDNMLSVAATTRSGKLASFSSYGKGSVHIAAPGGEILATHLEGYKSVSGTSFAVPMVSAAAALVWSRRPQLSYKQVIDSLMQSVTRVDGLKEKTMTQGILNVYGAFVFSDQLFARTATGLSGPMTSFSQPTASTAASRTSASSTVTSGTLCGGSYCPNNAYCQQLLLSARCVCNDGFAPNAGRTQCDPLSECSPTYACPQGRTCIRSGSNTYQCSACPTGYQVSASGQCVDIDECSLTTRVCSAAATCVNLIGTFDCRCPSGAVWNGKAGVDAQCLRLNSPSSGPCVNNGLCGPNSLCTVTDLSSAEFAVCRCIDGYSKHQQENVCVREGVEDRPVTEYLNMIGFSVEEAEVLLAQSAHQAGELLKGAFVDTTSTNDNRELLNNRHNGNDSNNNNNNNNKILNRPLSVLPFSPISSLLTAALKMR